MEDRAAYEVNKTRWKGLDALYAECLSECVRRYTDLLAAFISDSLGAGDGMNCGHIDPDNLNDDGNCQSIGSIDKCTLSLTKRGQTSNVLHPASVYALSAMTGVRGVRISIMSSLKYYDSAIIGTNGCSCLQPGLGRSKDSSRMLSAGQLQMDPETTQLWTGSHIS